MKILGIETSCDETAVAIIENGTKILSCVVASSKNLHEKTGGIIPEIAAREQVKCIIPVIHEAMKLCNNVTISNIDAIAVTIGPGLIGSLLVGVETAKTIAFVTNKPVVPVNHIFAHIYANWLTDNPPQFPILALVVSGGHTELFLMKKHGLLKWLGGTRDDASGEAFDKTARLLGLGYPGGPAIARQASKYQKSKIPSARAQGEYQIKLPRPMIDSNDLSFSFSGLKTAVMKEVNKLKEMKQFNQETINQLAYEIQESITDVLVAKTLKAAQQYKVKSIVLGGGVAANRILNDKFTLKIDNLKLKIKLHIPPPPLCTDNAAYIASFAYFNYQPVPWPKIQARPDLEVEV